MSAGAPAAIFFCLGTGAGLGALFLLFQAVRLLLGKGKLVTTVLDAAFCCAAAGVVFLCALAVDHGRLRFFQAALQCLGAWAVIAAFGPIFSRHFRKRRPRPRKKRKKTRRKAKNPQKKT